MRCEYQEISDPSSVLCRYVSFTATTNKRRFVVSVACLMLNDVRLAYIRA